MKKTLFLISLISNCLLHASEVDMKPAHISLFENGYGFISQRAALSEGTKIRLNSLPVPVSGSFWIASEQGVEIERLVSGMLDYKVSAALNPFTLAAANAGARARVTFVRGEQPPNFAEGIILPFPQSREERIGNTIDQISEPSDNPLLGSVLLLKLPNRTLALREAQILDITYLDPIKLPTVTERRPGVELELSSPAQGKLIETTSLSSGITWLPSYRLELGEDGRAHINAKATITNNLMNMENVALDLVLGSPKLTDLHSVDPMALRRAASYRPASSHMRSHALAKVDSTWTRPPATPTIMAGSTAPAPAINTGNVYFYPIASFTAKAGQVITQPLFQDELTYKNVYTWTLPDPRNMTVNSENAPPTIGAIDRTIHFENPLDIPLVEAPIAVIEAGRIAATNTLELTPPKTHAVVLLGEAINLTTRQTREHVETKSETHPYISDDDDSDEKSKKAPRFKTTRTTTYTIKLQVTNQMEEKAELVVTQPVQGEIVSASDAPSITRYEQASGSDNPTHNTLIWRMTLDAGSSKTISYTYKYKTSHIHTKKTAQ